MNEIWGTISWDLTFTVETRMYSYRYYMRLWGWTGAKICEA